MSPETNLFQQEGSSDKSRFSHTYHAGPPVWYRSLMFILAGGALLAWLVGAPVTPILGVCAVTDTT